MKLLRNRFLKNCLLLFVFLTLIEIVFRLISSIQVFDMTFVRIIIGLAILSIGYSFVFSWLNNIVNKIFNYILVFIVYAGFLGIVFQNSNNEMYKSILH